MRRVVCVVLVSAAAGLIAAASSGGMSDDHRSQAAVNAPPAARKLVAELSVLRRPQTAADRSLHMSYSAATGGRIVLSLTRLVAAGDLGKPGHFRTYLVVSALHPCGSTGATGSGDGASLITVMPHGRRVLTMGFTAAELERFAIVPTGPGFAAGGMVSSVVPDGVAHVWWRLHFYAPGADHPKLISVSPGVRDNIAVLRFAGHVAAARATWRLADGRVITSKQEGAFLPQCGSPPGPSATRGPAAQIPAAQPIAVAATPRAQLTFCRRNGLLRAICPRQIPASGSAPPATPGYYCMTRNPHESVRESDTSFRSNRCVFAQWSYVAGEYVRALSEGGQLSGWDGRKWVADEWSMLSPPVHVGVEIQAGSPQDLSLGSVAPWPEGRRPVSDALLNPARRQAISLGWVHWFARYGQLVLTPWGSCEQGDQLTFYLPPNAAGVSYAITLDAWMPAVRAAGKRIHRVFRFQSGPALPHVIATLKAIVGSALGT